MILETTKKVYNLSDHTLIMGILNVTPDSFSDGGTYTTIEKAIDQAIKMENAGANIIDIGGESTRPGHAPVSAEEEIERVVPIIEALKNKVQIPISIDTYKAETAKSAIEAGADIINDIWGAKKDKAIANVAAEYDVPIILMHNRTNMNYTSIIDDMKNDLQESIQIALDAGVKEKQIILDPGIGFAKTKEDNLTVLNHLEQFHELGYPLLLGSSRKTFIGHILDLPPEERDIGTGATTCLAITKGVQLVRVHNVEMHVQLARVTDAILREKM